MLTLEGFNILNIKAFKAMEGFIHYTGTELSAQYCQKMHLVLLPKGPTAVGNTFSGEYGSPQTIWRLQRMLDEIVIIAFYTQTGSTRRVFCTAKVLVPKYIQTFYCRFSVSVLLPWIDQHKTTTTKDDRFNCHLPHSLESFMGLNWDRNWFPQPRKDCDFGATQSANLFANTTAATSF